MNRDLLVCQSLNPGQATATLRREPASFMADYESCQRTLLEADDPVTAIAESCEEP